VCGAPPLVREDRGGRAAGVRVVLPRAVPGSHARRGEALTASKREAPPKMTPPIPLEGVRPLADHQVLWAAGARPATGAAERSQSAEGLSERASHPGPFTGSSERVIRRCTRHHRVDDPIFTFRRLTGPSAALVLGPSALDESAGPCPIFAVWARCALGYTEIVCNDDALTQTRAAARPVPAS
jgi:hypothetical protein